MHWKAQRELLKARAANAVATTATTAAAAQVQQTVQLADPAKPGVVQYYYQGHEVKTGWDMPTFSAWHFSVFGSTCSTVRRKAERVAALGMTFTCQEASVRILLLKQALSPCVLIRSAARL